MCCIAEGAGNMIDVHSSLDIVPSSSIPLSWSCIQIRWEGTRADELYSRVTVKTLPIR